MSNINQSAPPRRGPMGRGPMGRGGPAEKANNFKGAIIRLFSELKGLKILIYLAFILAIASSVLTIIAPDRLKNLTNEIQDGIKVNTDNLEIVMKNLSNLQTGKISDYEIDGVTITIDDQLELAKVFSTIGDDIDANTFYKKVDEMPKSVQEVVKPKMDMDNIKHIVTILAIIYIVSSIFSFIESIAMTDVANKFAKQLRSRIQLW